MNNSGGLQKIKRITADSLDLEVGWYLSDGGLTKQYQLNTKIKQKLFDFYQFSFKSQPPVETTNLTNAQPAVVEKLSALLSTYQLINLSTHQKSPAH